MEVKIKLDSTTKAVLKHLGYFLPTETKSVNRNSSWEEFFSTTLSMKFDERVYDVYINKQKSTRIHRLSDKIAAFIGEYQENREYYSAWISVREHRNAKKIQMPPVLMPQHFGDPVPQNPGPSNSIAPLIGLGSEDGNTNTDQQEQPEPLLSNSALSNVPMSSSSNCPSPYWKTPRIDAIGTGTIEDAGYLPQAAENADPAEALFEIGDCANINSEAGSSTLINSATLSEPGSNSEINRDSAGSSCSYPNKKRKNSSPLTQNEEETEDEDDEQIRKIRELQNTQQEISMQLIEARQLSAKLEAEKFKLSRDNHEKTIFYEKANRDLKKKLESAEAKIRNFEKNKKRENQELEKARHQLNQAQKESDKERDKNVGLNATMDSLKLELDLARENETELQTQVGRLLQEVVVLKKVRDELNIKIEFQEGVLHNVATALSAKPPN